MFINLIYCFVGVTIGLAFATSQTHAFLIRQIHLRRTRKSFHSDSLRKADGEAQLHGVSRETLPIQLEPQSLR